MAADRKLDPKTTERKQDQAAQPPSLLQDRSEQQGTMGTSITKEQKAVCRIMKMILQKHHTEVESFDLGGFWCGSLVM